MRLKLIIAINIHRDHTHIVVVCRSIDERCCVAREIYSNSFLYSGVYLYIECNLF